MTYYSGQRFSSMVDLFVVSGASAYYATSHFHFVFAQHTTVVICSLCQLHSLFFWRLCMCVCAWLSTELVTQPRANTTELKTGKKKSMKGEVEQNGCRRRRHRLHKTHDLDTTRFFKRRRLSSENKYMGKYEQNSKRINEAGGRAG